MMPDIFSSFDPTSFNYLLPSISMVLFINIVMFLSLNRNIWSLENKMFSSFLFKYNMLTPEIERTYMFNLNPLTHLMQPIFILIMYMNLMGLLPYTFSITSHLIFTLSIGLPMWLMMILSSLIKSPKATIAHLLPEGAPEWLNPFLVLIETTSITVRPITLSFRLAANMSAGHIVLGLVGIYGAAAWFNSILSSILLISISLGYILFEVAICMIQAYIFFLLLTLYANDHAH